MASATTNRRMAASDTNNDAAAIKAAKQSTFSPGLRDGKPVPVLVTIQIAFTLRQ
jgi:hypothetical protein